MNHKEFADVVTKELDYVWELLCSKSKEYDFGDDRFHSFKVGGQLQGISQEKCLLGYLTKHIVSIYDMCDKVEEFSFEKFQEKITDYINYGLLLLGMIQEEKNKEEKNKEKENTKTEELTAKKTKVKLVEGK